jgi:hypothetical protein
MLEGTYMDNDMKRQQQYENKILRKFFHKKNKEKSDSDE